MWIMGNFQTGPILSSSLFYDVNSKRLQQTCINQIISSGLGDNIPPFPIVIDMKQFNY